MNYTGPYQTQFQFNMPRDLTVYEGVRYQYYRPNLYFGIKPSGRSALSVRGRFGGGVDYANNRAGDQRRPGGSRGSSTARSSRVSLQLSYNLDQLSVEGGRLYQANLGQLKAVYHINVRTFVRAILQYTDITRDPDLYLFPVDGAHAPVLLAVPLLVQAQPADRDLRRLFGQLAAGRSGNDLRQQNRTFFVKLGYAWAF